MSRDLKLQVVLSAIDKATAPIRGIMQSSSGLGKQLKETRDQLRNLEKQQGAINSFRELKRGSEQSAAALQDQQRRVKELAQQLAATPNPTKAMTREFDAATRAAGKLKTAHGNNTQQLQAVRARLQQAGVSTRNLGAEEASLRKKITETNSALAAQKSQLESVAAQQKKLAGAKAQMERTQQLAGNMATTGAAGLATGGGVLYAGARFLGEGMEFDSSMSKVQSLARLDSDSPEAKMLREQARKLGAETMFSATEAAQGQGFLAMAGFTPQAILDAMPGVLDMAKAGDVDLARTADIASNILSGMKLEAGDMGRVGDVLVGAFTRSNTSLEQLGETMKYVAPVASSVGQDIETMAAMAGKLGDAGIQGGMAGTALRSIVNRLSSPPKMAADALDELSISAKDAQGNMRQMPDILTELYEKTKNMGDADRAGMLKAIAGSEAVSAMQVLVDQAGSGGLQEFIRTLRESEGEASATAKKMADNLVGDLDELSSAFSDVKIEVFEGQNGALRDLAQTATRALGAIGAWAKENPELAGSIIKVVAVLAALVAAGGALMVLIGSILGPLAMMKYGLTVLGIKSLSIIPALKGIGAAIMLIGKAMIASPLGLFAAAAVIAAVLIVKYWDVVKAFFNGFISGFIDGFMNMGRAVIDVFNPVIPVFKAVMSAASKAFAWLKELLAPVSSAKETLEGAASAGKTFGQVIGAFAALTGAALAIKAVGTAVLFVGKALLANPIFFAIAMLAGAAYLIYRNWDDMVGGFMALLGAFGTWWADKIAILAQDWDYLTGLISAGWDSLWGGITGMLDGIWSTITEAFNSGIGGITALLLDWSPLGLFYQIMQPVFDWFGLDLPAKFSEFGANIISGLVDGIKGMASKAKEAITGVGSNVIGWFKDKLGIRSPSRVFAALGDDTVDGLAAGIRANENGPLTRIGELGKKLTAAAGLSLAATVAVADPDALGLQQRIVPEVQAPELLRLPDLQQRTVPKVQAPELLRLPDLQQRIVPEVQAPELLRLPDLHTPRQLRTQEQRPIRFDQQPPLRTTSQRASAPSAPDNIAINIHAAPGMDERALAALVRQELEKAQRQQQVRRRSQLGDLD